MGVKRRFKRDQLKAEYGRFGEEWRKRQRGQKLLLARGKELPEGEELLGRKPRFGQWLSATVVARRMRDTVPMEMDVVGSDGGDKEIDLGWDEVEGTDVALPGDQTIDRQAEVQGQL